MSIIAVTGLSKEARIAKRADLTPVIGACDAALLRERLDAVAGDATGVVSFGIAGSLSPLLKAGDVVVGHYVVSGNEHYVCDEAWSKRLLTHLPGAHSVIVAGVDQIASNISMKRALIEAAGAHIVDMESHIAARFARERNLPFAVLRTISDGHDRALPPAALVPLKADGRPRLAAVLKSLMGDLQQLPELLQTGRESGKAFRSLARTRRILGPGLAFPVSLGTDLR